VTHPTDSSHPPRRRRLLREFGAALVLVLAVVVFILNQRWHRARLEVAEAVAAADQLDPGWRFEDLAAERRLPPDERNSALQVLKVKSLLPHDWTGPPPDAGEVEQPAPELTRLLDAREELRLREALKRAGPALDEARKLADMPDGRYPVAWAADIESTVLPWFDAIHSVGPVLGFDGQLRSQDGDSDGALDTARAVLNLGRSLGEEPFCYGATTRLGTRFHAVSAVEHTLAQGQPSEGALATMQEALRGEDAVSLSLVYFRGNRAGTHRFLSQVDDGEHRLSEWG
jgi:hypothetical protein